jgi:hypothetical protein
MTFGPVGGPFELIIDPLEPQRELLKTLTDILDHDPHGQGLAQLGGTLAGCAQLLMEAAAMAA